MRFLPPSATREARLLLTSRALRAVTDGCIGVVLPAYLLALGFDAVRVGILTTTTMFGSALLTLAVSLRGNRYPVRSLLLMATALMAATGLGFASFQAFWPLVIVAFVGTLNPSAGDVSVFLPLEQSALSGAVADSERTPLFARYSLIGSMLGAAGSLIAIVPDRAAAALGIDHVHAFQATFFAYAFVAVIAALVYRQLPKAPKREGAAAQTPAPVSALGPSRGIVLRLAAIFCIDSFAGGLVAQSILTLWLFHTFDLSVSAVARIFFCTQMLSAVSYLAASWISRRIGLINTMVFSHLPANLCLMAVPFTHDLRLAVALLLVRSLLSQMDVPTRTSYVMAVVTPAERPAAAGVTAVPRSLASAIGPTLGGLLLQAGGFAWPLLLGGLLKAIYDLTLLAMFRRIKPPEEC